MDLYKYLKYNAFENVMNLNGKAPVRASQKSSYFHRTIRNWASLRSQYGSLVTPVPCLCGVRMMILVILLALYDLRSHKFRHQIIRRPYGKARGARTNMKPHQRVYDKKNASYTFNSALKATYMPYYMLKYGEPFGSKVS